LIIYYGKKVTYYGKKITYYGKKIIYYGKKIAKDVTFKVKILPPTSNKFFLRCIIDASDTVKYKS